MIHIKVDGPGHPCALLGGFAGAWVAGGGHGGVVILNDPIIIPTSVLSKVIGIFPGEDAGAGGAVVNGFIDSQGLIVPRVQLWRCRGGAGWG